MRRNHVIRFLLPFELLLLGASLPLLAQDTHLVSIRNIPDEGFVGTTFVPKYLQVGDGIGSVTASPEDVCKAEGDLVTFLDEGQCVLVAHSTIGHTTWNGDPQTFWVVSAVTISDLPDEALVGMAFPPQYSHLGAGIGSVTSRTEDVCKVDAHSVSFVAPGTCTLVAHSTINHATRNGIPQTLPVAAVMVTNVPRQPTVGQSFAPKFPSDDEENWTVTATPDTICKVTSSGATNSTVAFIGPGACTLIAAYRLDQTPLTGQPQMINVAPVNTPKPLTISIVKTPVAALIGTDIEINFAGDGIEVASASAAVCTWDGPSKTVSFEHKGICQLTPYADAGHSGRVYGLAHFIDVVKKICDPALTNESCTIPLDRENAVTPPTIQAAPNAKIYVFVANPRPFEKISVERTGATSALPPEPFAAIYSAFMPSLSAVQLAVTRGPGVLRLHAEPAVKKEIENRIQTIAQEQQDLSEAMKDLNKQFEKVNGQLKVIQQDPAKQKPGDGNPVPDLWDPPTFAKWKTELLCEIAGRGITSPSPSEISCDPVGVIDHSKPNRFEARIKTLEEENAVLSKLVSAYPSELTEDKKTFRDDLSSLQANQVLLGDGLKSIKEVQTTLAQTASIIQKQDSLKPPDASPLADLSQSKTLTQTTTFSVTVTNALAPNTSTQVATVTAAPPKQLATVTTATRATSHWEVFSGAILSTIPNRTFQENPVIVNGFKTNTQISEFKSYPTVVPFASVNYRLREWSLGGRRWGLYGTGGLGINPYTKTVDYGGGISISYRSLVLSPLVHFARDTRLTQGLYANELLGLSNPPGLTTQQYWRPVFGLAISVRLSNLLTSSSSSKSGGN